jgi:hypothetical protein
MGRRLYFRIHRKGNVGQSLANPNGTSNGPWSEPPRGGSPSGPLGGPLKRRFSHNLCYPLPTLVAILALTLITPLVTKKVLLYPRYVIGFDLDVHIWVFRKAINASGKWNNVDIINLLYLTLCDDIFEWGGKCHAKSPKLCFWWIGSYFCKHYWKVQKDEQVYMVHFMSSSKMLMKVEV